jgi:hypothetical protein
MPRLAHHCAVVLMLLSPFSLAAADRPAASCYRLDLQDPPSWITSGATWDRENERLLMVDPVRDRVVSYNLLGEQDTISNLSPGLRPVKIARSNDGFLLELADGSMLSLDRRLAVTDRNLAAKLSPSTKTSLYQWAAGASGSFVAFSAMVHDETVQYGFFRAQENSGLQSLLPADEHQKDFFLLGYPYIASTGDETFFLSMAKHPAIYRVRDGKAEKLPKALPRKYATRPDFSTPLMTGPRSAVARYAELETLSIPAGLYAQDGYLYLLTREPAVGGKTTWWFYQIDPAGAGSVLGRVRLPTSANHLTVIPTPDRGWMFTERGKVELDPSRQHQTQKVGPLVVISNEAIRSLSVPNSCPKGGGILWANETHSRALFVPEALVSSKMMLPVDVYAQNHLDRRLARESKNAASPCDFLEPSMGQGTLPDASSLEDLVTSSQIAVVGKILNTEPGWDALLGHVATKVNIEVTRSLKGNLKTGSRVSFLSPGGKFRSDKRVCTSPRKEFYQPQDGDEIVISAESSTANSQLLESPYVFPLSGGKVQPEPYPDLISEQKPLPLNKLLYFSNRGSL